MGVLWKILLQWVDAFAFYVILVGVVFVVYGDFTVDPRKEQRVCTKFCVKSRQKRDGDTENYRTSIREAKYERYLGVLFNHDLFKASRISADDDQDRGRSISSAKPDVPK